MVSTAVAGGIVVQGTAASGPSADALAVQNLSNSVGSLEPDVRDLAVAAAGSARQASAAGSRDASRMAMAGVVSQADEAAALADAEQARKATAAKAAAAKKAKAVEAARKKAQRWVSPIANYTLTSGYGWRWGRMHPAQDLAAPTGTPVRALSTGTVIFAGWSSEGYGNFVKIRYWDGTVSWFAHNSRLLVSVGEQVKPGQVVSYSGSTGNSTGPHLHLEIHPRGGAAVAPRAWLGQKGVRL
ncbi:M23 family metallopeptidase [Intrasporangium sp.]|uniref:M23 family metallopeptidase n=1 Tax=Intrasporangium sp. TaxID=1925024 RepID=UPI0032215E64